ncbi:MAG: bifunctional nuclease family protein [Bacteroidaceae bacterium]|nr:bifunctional nuclease family protein [Bacteroidaceae bacterium]
MKLVDLEIPFSGAIRTAGENFLILLKEKNGNRSLPISISGRRGNGLMARMLFGNSHLPVTMVDIMKSFLDQLEVRLDRIEILNVENGVFTCTVYAVTKEGKELVMSPCYAPDALILVNTYKCRFCIDEKLLQAQYIRHLENGYAMNIRSMSVELLEIALKDAISKENFEIASDLRDEIKKRKQQ